MDPKEIMKKNNKEAEAVTDVAVPNDLPENISQGVRKTDDGVVRRIVIDRQACIGANSCVVVAEKLYQLDEENLAYIVDPESHDQETIKMSAMSCPVLAIHLYDKDGNKVFPE